MGNWLTTRDSPPSDDCDSPVSPECPALPIADKRISVEKSRALLRSASTKAIAEVVGTNSSPNRNIDDLSAEKFPFENAVFEGGGVKGIAYVGAIKCLEDMKIKIKRFAGSSMGASVAALLSVGYTADELVSLYIQDLSIFIRDSHCEYLCFLPRLLRNLGMNPGKKFIDWYGRCLAVKTGTPDITFREVYDMFGTELCVVVLNMNTGREELFHPKTTPNIPVRMAVRMSISVPGVLQPVRLLHSGGDLDTYIDGGVICNYPIYVFDGWWLSMSPQDQIYHKLKDIQGCSHSKQSLSKLFDKSCRFAERNSKTIGFKQTTHQDFFNDTIISEALFIEDRARQCNSAFSRPNSKLAKRRMKQLRAHETDIEAKSVQLSALIKLFEVLQCCSEESGYINTERLASYLLFPQISAFTKVHFDLIFQGKITPDTLLNRLSAVAEKSLVSPDTLDGCLRNAGLDINRMLENSLSMRQDRMHGAKLFWSRLHGNITGAARRSFVKLEDLERTVNIHTDYIEFLDFDISLEDKEFLLQQGYKSTLSYLTKWTSSVNNSTNNDIHSRHVAAEDTINVYGDDSDSKSLLYIDEEEYDYIMCNFKTDNVI